MKVVWTPEAQQDRIDIWEYIAVDNPHAAARMDNLFSGAAASLGEHPKSTTNDPSHQRRVFGCRR